MMGSSRLRITLLLVLGFALFAHTAAWPLRYPIEKPIVPDLGDGESFTGGSGGPYDQGFSNEYNEYVDVATEARESTLADADRVVSFALKLRELLKSAWLLTRSDGIHP